MRQVVLTETLSSVARSSEVCSELDVEKNASSFAAGLSHCERHEG